MRKSGFFAYQILLIFSLLGVLFVPFSFRYLDFQSKITKLFFEDLIHLITYNFKEITIANSEITSDSATLYLLFIILFLIAVIAVSILSFFDFWKTHKNFIFKVIQIILTYYLACIMLKYGFDKIFKVQFYLPEPNTLYTPLGMLDKDILFWSTMGTSYSYNIFMGLTEVIPALMLLFNKTRVLGLFILLGVLINVVFINFGFDISVKLYSLFLLLICFLLLSPNLKKIIQFFISNKPVVLSRLEGSALITSKPIRITIKTLVFFFLFMESVFPYVQKENFNDDKIARNPLYGAYEVVKTEKKQVEKNSVNLKIKRIFIHRNNYFIFQYTDDTMEDFHLEINETENQFTLTNYDGQKIKLQYKYSENSKTLEIYSPELGITIYSKSLPWRKLPLLQPLFHWTVDEIH
ncbi:hypothetical protein [Flavobacterium sp. ov086]|uniref:hypothetical protein n=1 Tax=Flavobacterium sp. ov086 TaxID=1761785 RepID=UPI000B745CAD|nr:hypothetical protein [Flavobacterium sp. ov086]SNR40220.1 hypothetical protein SAMN04487979_10523 [Flavobacterium sp. ov086]